jgi:deoxyribodipyrimidine photo-lyase
VSAAGLTGGRVNKFNILKQSKDYDADGDYVRAWLPELRKVPQAKIHAPWQMSQQEQEASGCIIGKDYPRPAPTNNQFGGSSGGGSRGRGGGRGARGDGGRRFNDGGGRGGRASGGRGPSRGYGKGNKRPSDFDMYG